MVRGGLCEGVRAARCFVKLSRTELDTRFPHPMAAVPAAAVAGGIGGDVTAIGRG